MSDKKFEQSAGRAAGVPAACWWGFGVRSVCCAIFALFGAINFWPPLGGDAPAYFAPAVEMARGNNFENTVWLAPLNDSIDGAGGRRYIYHGFLHPLLVGLAARLTGTDASGCVAAAYVVLFWRLWRRAGRSWGTHVWLHASDRQPRLCSGFSP
ncbi:MAG: hypothetical protein WED15_08810 [Akkermansiaceae bacterium]